MISNFLNVDRDSNTKSGNTTSRYFCKSCGTPVHTQGPSRPGLTVIKLGLFAGKMKLAEPQVEIFWANHEDWEEVGIDIRTLFFFIENLLNCSL